MQVPIPDSKFSNRTIGFVSSKSFPLFDIPVNLLVVFEPSAGDLHSPNNDMDRDWLPLDLVHGTLSLLYAFAHNVRMGRAKWRIPFSG